MPKRITKGEGGEAMCNQEEIPHFEGEMEMINDHEVRAPMRISLGFAPKREIFDSNWAAQVEEAMRLEALAKTFAR